MSRTLVAALDAVNNGAYQAIFRWKVYNSRAAGASYNHTKIAGFKISDLEITAEIPSSAGPGVVGNYIQLLRGAIINGTEYLVGTSYYKIHETTQVQKSGISTVKASLIPKIRLTLTGDDTYKNVITAFCTACALTASFKNPTATYWSYKFLPAGKQVILNDARLFLNMLQQKYLITASDQEGDVLQFSSLTADSIDITTRNADFEDPPFLDMPLTTTRRDNEVRYFWRDEDESIYFEGTATKRLHNLGYLESTDSPPDIREGYILAYRNAQVDLELTTNDVIGRNWDAYNLEYNGKEPYKFTEVFDRQHEPSWYMNAEAINPFQNTEGGALPSTIERVSNYTPLNTSGFDGVLSANDNNLQAAMGTIDDHGHNTANDARYSRQRQLIEGLQLVYNSAASLDIGKGSCYAENGDYIKLNSNITKSSLSLTASTWYHVYVYLSSGTPAAEVVTTAPTAWEGTAYSKTSDTSRRYVGSIYAIATDTITNFQHDVIANYVAYKTNTNRAPFRVLSNGSATTFTSIDCSGIVPVTSRVINLWISNASTNAYLMTSTSDDGYTYAGGGTIEGILNVNAERNTASNHPVDSSQDFKYRFDTAPTPYGAWFFVLGYYFDR